MLNPAYLTGVTFVGGEVEVLLEECLEQGAEIRVNNLWMAHLLDELQNGSQTLQENLPEERRDHIAAPAYRKPQPSPKCKGLFGKLGKSASVSWSSCSVFRAAPAVSVSLHFPC